MYRANGCWRWATVAGFLLFILAGPFYADDVKVGDHKAVDKAIHAGLRDAINQGASLFNEFGDYAGCYRTFHGALLSVKPLLAHHPHLQKAISEGIARAEKNPRMPARAWILRKVLDDVRTTLAPAETGKKEEKKAEEKKPEEKKKEMKKPEEKKKEAKKPEDKKKPEEKKKEDKKPEEKKKEDKKPEAKKPDEKKTDKKTEDKKKTDVQEGEKKAAEPKKNSAEKKPEGKKPAKKAEFIDLKSAYWQAAPRTEALVWARPGMASWHPAWVARRGANLLF